MEDTQIVELFWARDEAALAETEIKYGRYCLSIANSILHDAQDAQECVNDAYLGAWNAIPPHKPAKLSTFIGKIVRRVSLNRLFERSADKRGGGAIDASIDELDECVPGSSSLEDVFGAEELTEILNAFLGTLPLDERRVFMRRYWFFDSISDICARFGFGESKVKVMLKRTRDKLRARLEKEGVWV